MRKKLILFAIFALLCTAVVANASIVLITNRADAGSDLADWGQLGSSFTPIPNPFNATSTGGVGITGTFACCGGERRDQGNGWAGNFANGDHLVWTEGNGPLTLSFSTPLSAVGAQIQADYFGAFTAQIQAYNGNTLLGTFSESGNSTSNGDNSAIFIGVKDSTAEITSIVFSLTSCSNACTDFAINQLSLTSSGGQQVPEPASMFLLGSGLLGVASSLRKRLQK